MSSIANILSEYDKGDEVQRRFRYQNTFTCIPLILMFTNNEIEHLMCEHHEDILAKVNDGYYGFQIKTKEGDQNILKLNDEGVINSFSRFISLDSEYPGQFTKFILVSNSAFPIVQKPMSISHFLNEIKRAVKSYSKQTRSYIEKLTKKTKKSNELVINTLKKVHCQGAPSIDDIDSVIIREHMPSLPKCDTLSVKALEKILDDFLLLVYRASSKKIEGSVKYYLHFTSEGGDKLIREKIESKKLTREKVEEILLKNLTYDYTLLNKENHLDKPKVGSIQVLRNKMNEGKIKKDIIDNMEDLIASAEVYVSQHFSISNEKIDLSHLQTYLLSIYSDCLTLPKTKDHGQNLFQNIIKEIRKIADEKPGELRNCPYQILKGFVGILVKDCKISFV